MKRDGRWFLQATALPLALILLLQGANCRNDKRDAAVNNSQTKAESRPVAPPDDGGAEANANRRRTGDARRNDNSKGGGREGTTLKQEGEGRSVATGVWGGAHINLEVSDGGARVEFDCAHGAINQKLTLDGSGAFDARGTFSKERGGPVRIDEKPASEPARYSGRVEGDTMTLNVTLSDSGTDLGSFTLKRGRPGRLTKCL